MYVGYDIHLTPGRLSVMVRGHCIPRTHRSRCRNLVTVTVVTES